jgi:glycosyltransferase involved in cell wall biosynthesis
VNVGFYSPFPPARTGIADYSAALFAAMKRTKPDIPLLKNSPGERNFYHIGNNGLHKEIYGRALATPGVAMLHDAVLMHFLLGSLTRESFIEEFVFNYGEWHRQLASDLWAGRARSAVESMYFRYPMLKRIAAGSRAIVVHNPEAAAIVRSHAPDARVVEIPHLFEPPPPPPAFEIERLRASWNLKRSDCLFAVFGHLRESKRIQQVLRTFANVRREVPGAALLLAGDFVSTDLARAAEPLLGAPGIIRLGYTPDEHFWMLAHACDVCINLRYPAAGETSGIGVRLLGIGRPVLFSEGLAVSRIPQSACVRIDSGPSEEEMLGEIMIHLARSPAARREMGRMAAAYTLEFHCPERVARLFWDVLLS